MNVYGELILGRRDTFISIESERLHFPTICPVCSRPTTEESMIAAISTKERIAASQMRAWDRFYMSRSAYSRKLVREGMDVRRLVLPVCEDHVISALDRGKMRVIFGLLAGFSILGLIWQSAFIAFQIYDGLQIAPATWLLLAFYAIVAVISISVLGPTAIDRAIKVVDTAFGGNFLLLKVKNPEYADELVRLNPMTAKKVRKKKR
jgi:hypothetical protein